MKPGTPTIPWPAAVAVLALAGAGLWYGAVRLHALPSPSRQAAETPAAHPAKPAAAHRTVTSR